MLTSFSECPSNCERCTYATVNSISRALCIFGACSQGYGMKNTSDRACVGK